MRRRTFLRLVGAGGVAISFPWLPGCADRSSGVATAARFLTPEERELLDQLAAAIIPEDQTVGAVGAGAIEYVDRWLAAFDNPEPDVYRAGPFSGRWPFQDPENGEPSDDFPSNGFLEVLPLTRLQEAAFRIELYGSGSVPNGDINAPLVPPTPGLRALYREAITALERTAREAGVGFGELSDAARLAAFGRTSRDFQDAFLTNLAEGMFAAPEYGGNPNGVAWRDYFFDGDSQPLGHTLYDARADALLDRPDQPNQAIDPSLPNAGLEPEVESFVDTIVRGQGGKRFF
jgi:hypothetical protein